MASEGGVTPTGTINITNNGTYDVTNYASANVSVAGSNNVKLIVYNKNSSAPAGIWLCKGTSASSGFVEPVVSYQGGSGSGTIHGNSIGAYWEIEPNTDYSLWYGTGFLSQNINISSDQWIVVNHIAPP